MRRANGNIGPAFFVTFSPFFSSNLCPDKSNGKAGEAMAGDKQWFCAQVEKHKTSLYRLAYSILQNPTDAEDAAAEAVCKAFGRLDSLRDRDRFRPWLLRIAANEAYTILRSRGQTVPLEDVEENFPCPSQEENGLWPLVQVLPWSLRSPVVLFYYDGYSVREIAHILGLREGAVKTRLCRGRQLLKEMLEKEELT